MSPRKPWGGIKKASAEQQGRKYGYRSGLEDVVQKALDAKGVNYTYEEHTLCYLPDPKPKKYTPDFVLPNGIIVETKGRWLTPDRIKMKLITEQHPDLDIRMVFNSSKSKISKTSKTTYAVYCSRLGMPYADKMIPQEWIDESYDKSRWDAIKKALHG